MHLTEEVKSDLAEMADKIAEIMGQLKGSIMGGLAEEQLTEDDAVYHEILRENGIPETPELHAAIFAVIMHIRSQSLGLVDKGVSQSLALVGACFSIAQASGMAFNQSQLMAGFEQMLTNHPRTFSAGAEGIEVTEEDDKLPE
jgi:hypothetical protein